MKGLYVLLSLQRLSIIAQCCYNLVLLVLRSGVHILRSMSSRLLLSDAGGAYQNMLLPAWAQARWLLAQASSKTRSVFSHALMPACLPHQQRIRPLRHSKAGHGEDANVHQIPSYGSHILQAVYLQSGIFGTSSAPTLLNMTHDWPREEHYLDR